MNEELKSIYGTSIIVGVKTIPTAHLRYYGNEKTFVTWTITDGIPGLNANDKCLLKVYSTDIDIYSDGNYLDIVNKVKEIMEEHDWEWVEDSTEMFEEETGLYHITCSFEKERN